MRIHLTWVLALLWIAVSACDGTDGPVVDGGDVGDDDDLVVDEYFQQNPGADVDVLFVVDNSCSMAEEQELLMTNFWFFVQHLVDTSLDYHIGITVLDLWEGAYGYPAEAEIGALFGTTPIIDRSTADPTTAFMDNMTMGDDGVGVCEVGLETVYRALSEPLASGVNQGFYRDAARLMVILVSDENDGSVPGSECQLGQGPSDGYEDWESLMDDQDFVPWFTGLKGPDWTFQVHFAAIVGDGPDGCSSWFGDAEPADGYLQVIDALGEDHATFHSICDSNWMPVMDELGVRAAGLTLQFGLSHEPVKETLQVFLDLDGADGPAEAFLLTEDPTWSTDYAYWYDAARNSIDFDPSTAPPVGSELHVSYERADP